MQPVHQSLSRWQEIGPRAAVATDLTLHIKACYFAMDMVSGAQ
jgi:hypothetical protein